MTNEDIIIANRKILRDVKRITKKATQLLEEAKQFSPEEKRLLRESLKKDPSIIKKVKEAGEAMKRSADIWEKRYGKS